MTVRVLHVGGADGRIRPDPALSSLSPKVGSNRQEVSVGGCKNLAGVSLVLDTIRRMWRAGELLLGETNNGALET
jgi:hypothetical protein